MTLLISKALEYYRTVLLFLSLFIMWGLNSYLTIPKESTPDVKIPIIYISIIYEGMDPLDGERLLIKPIEKELRNLEGIKELKSTAFEGGANIIIEFHAGFNSEKAKIDVRDRLDMAKPKLPPDTKEPVINEINLSQLPVLFIKLTGDAPQRALLKITRSLRDEIESQVASVLKAEIVGDREDSVEIQMTPEKYEQYGITLEDSAIRLNRNNKTIAAGGIEQEKGRFTIKVSGLLDDIEEISMLPIAVQGDTVLKLKDIAQVKRTYKDPKSIAHDRVRVGEDSQSTIVLEVSKRTGEHLIETIEKVKNVVAEQSKSWPAHITVNYAQDRSDRIRDMLNELQNSIILAVFLVIGVIAYALGWRSSLLVGFAVPGSFLIGMMVIGFLGYTLNIVVLFSLIFSVGMLVEGAIIIVEYADRQMTYGLNLWDAYRQAAIRMAWPVITSIITILVVFLPLLFWPGVVGQFMKFMPITLIAVLTASIFMALIFLPALTQIMSDWSYKVRQNHHDMKDFISGPLQEWYIRQLKRVIDQPQKVIAVALILLIIVKGIHSFFGKGVEFFPEVEPEIAQLIVHGRGPLSIFEKENYIRDIESKIKDMKEFKSLYSRVGEQSKSSGKDYTEDTLGTITLEFIDWKERRKADDILEEVETRVKDIPGVWVEITKEKPGPPSIKPIYLEIKSNDRSQLEPIVKKIRHHMEQLEGLKSVDDDLSMPRIQWEIKVDRERAARVDTDMTTLGYSIRMLTTGAKIGSYRPDDYNDEVDIMLRFASPYRTIEHLKSLRIKTKEGNVPLSVFSQLKPGRGVGQILRSGGYPVQHVFADIKPGVLIADKIADIQTYLDKIDVPSEISMRFKGEDEDRKETGAFLLKAFGVALFLVAAILVTQFNSFFSMGVVLSAVIMSTIGVFIGLVVHHLAFGIVMGGIGIIALAGIIVSNNIILIDTYDKLRDQKKQQNKELTISDIRDIIIETCTQRFRPVILTKLTTILGLLPIMFKINIDFLKLEITHGAPSMQWWVLLSTCIVYGVLFASSLTLIVTPCALMWRSLARAKKGQEII